MRFAEVKFGRAHEVADVFDENKAPGGRFNHFERELDLRRIEVAALSRVDLHGLGARGADALGVVVGLLIAFDHQDFGGVGGLAAHGGAENFGLARARGAHEIEG